MLILHSTPSLCWSHLSARPGSQGNRSGLDVLFLLRAAIAGVGKRASVDGV